MTRYQLAKLIAWAETLHSRKKMQKVIFMLQAARCPLSADFYLHLYGTYSEDVARLTDEMARQGLLVEESKPTANGLQYSYHLPEPTKQQIARLEETDEGKKWASELAPFEAKAKSLLQADVKELEYASTILYFHMQGDDWPQAVEKAVDFKGTAAVKNALGLAKKALA